MKSKSEYINLLNEIKGKIIAIVYIYEGEDAEGFEHYDIWKSNLISCWLNAIQELQCIPYIMDVRTFLYKVANNTLPPIDYVINMNAGCINLSTLGLVPSICGFIGKKCIPCNTPAIIAGENKSYANMIAQSLDFNVPKEGTHEGLKIYRPLNYGSSKGVKIIDSTNHTMHTIGIYQEFIEGYDVTIPFMYNPLSDSFDMLPAIFYIPELNSPSWFFDSEAKETDVGFKRVVIPNVSKELNIKIKKLINKIDIDTYCRIDFRMKTTNTITTDNLSNIMLDEKNAYFIEINPMPTIEIGNNFHISFENINETNPFHNTKEIYNSVIKNATPHGFILSCALIAKIKSKH